MKSLFKKVLGTSIAFSLLLSTFGCGNINTPSISSLSNINNSNITSSFNSFSTNNSILKPYAILSYQSLDSDLGDIYDSTPVGNTGYTQGDVTQYSIMSDLNALESIGSNKNLSIFTWVDFAGSKDTFKSFMTQDNDLNKFTSELTPIRERNMGYYVNLEKFIQEGLIRAQAKNIILDISSHGGGYWGISPDYTSKHRRISLDGLQLSLHRAIKGARKLDIMSFYACLMSSLEVAYQLRNDVKIILASGDVMTSNLKGPEVSYYRSFDIINKNPNIDIENLSKHVVDSAGPQYSSVFTATKAAATEQLTRSIDKLAGVLIKVLPSRKNDIFKACVSTPKYPNLLRSNMSSAEYYLQKNKPGYTQEDVIFYANLLTDMVDIKALTSSLRQKLADNTEVINAINEVESAVDKAVLKTKVIDGKFKWSGLSIYLPYGVKVDNKYLKTAFAKDTQWDTFINMLTKN